MKTPLVFYVMILFISFSCSRTKTKDDISDGGYKLVSYVDVGKMMDTVSMPYVIDLQKDKKRIVFMGCVHDVDSTHKQFAAIGKYFDALQPQITLNEGGQIPDSIHYASVNEAIRDGGETGVLKYYSDNAGIKMMNGDLSAKMEFPIALRKHRKEELYLYYVIERIAIPYYYGAYGDEPFEASFNNTIEDYFIKNGFPLNETEKKLEYLKALYKKFTGQDFDIKSFDLEAFDYINDNCKFCAIGRTSKMVRDSILLSRIDQALDQYDRVMVTFGGGHALAVEPALKQIINKGR